MKILSFDIGIKNLAYCFMSCDGQQDGQQDQTIQTLNIIDWKVIDIFEESTVNVTKLTIDTIAERLLLTLESLFGNIDCDTVLLENQPVQKNPTMKSVQMIIYSFFFHKKLFDPSSPILEIKLISAISKNKLSKFIPDTEEKTAALGIASSYRKNKVMGVIMAKYFLNKFVSENESIEWVAVLNRAKKKDDMADAFLQGICHLNGKKYINID
jgi:hypothetical protein